MILTTIELLMFYSYKKTWMCVFLVYLPQFKHRVRAILTQEISEKNNKVVYVINGNILFQTHC